MPGLVLGYAVGKDYIEPPAWASAVLVHMSGGGEPPPSTGALRLQSIFLPLDSEWGIVPISRPGPGGGLTSFYRDVLLLTHDGTILAARTAQEIRPTRLQPPDNGFSKLEWAAQSERYSHVSFDPTKFRYNDILHFRTNAVHGLAISYSDWNDTEECYSTTIAVLPLALEVNEIDQVSSRPEDWRKVFSTSPCLPLKSEWRAVEGHMAGGRMAFEAPQTVYLASGDYSWDGTYAPVALAQQPDNDYGKVIAIDLVSGDARHVSSGHRNPQGIAFDASGQLWTAEHGPRGGDELNRIEEGANFGWPETVLGTEYSNLPIKNLQSAYGRHDLFSPPAFAWLPSVAPSNLTLIDGFHQSWDGDLLMATLRRNSLFRLRLDDGHVRFAEEIPVGEFIRYVHQHTDGRIVLWTDMRRLHFVSVSEAGFAAELSEQLVDEMELDEPTRNGVRAAWRGCMECHSLEPGVSLTAPSLAAVYEGPIAGTDYGAYSQALRDRGGRWSRDALREYLMEPASVAAGTTMPDPAITDPRVLDAVIDLLAGLTNTAEP